MSSSYLDRQSTVAPGGYQRFLVPPAALAVHLAIGQAYAFSTFNLPLTKLIGLKHAAPADWKLTEVGWTFSIAIAILGLSAAVFGRWVERVGPRKAMFTAAVCFSGGFLVSAVLNSVRKKMLDVGFSAVLSDLDDEGNLRPESTLGPKL